jgi:predicted RNA-binding protein YlxR (DUF448 family)
MISSRKCIESRELQDQKSIQRCLMVGEKEALFSQFKGDVEES